jgi:hypothetical protein
MKYSNTIEIALPRDQVAVLLADPVYLPNWLRGMVLHEPVHGAHGQLGAQSRVVLQSGKQTFEITETITRREPENLHDIPLGTVVHFERESVGGGMWSRVHDRLTEASPTTTLWVSDSEYRFDGVMMRAMGLVMPAAFRKQSQQHMNDFKAFAEHGIDVREGTP